MDMPKDYTSLVDDYYFNEFLPKLHPSLQAIGADSQVLRHTETYQKMETITRDVAFPYWSNPWAVQDIFPVSDEQCYEVAKAVSLLFVQCVVVDNYTDGQSPDSRLIPLYAQQLGLYAAQQLMTLLPNQPEFWAQYYDTMIGYFHGMVVEFESVAGDVPTFSSEVMGRVDAGIAFAFRIQCAAMGVLSGHEAYIEPVSKAFEILLLADQFTDDALDWLEDWQLGRTRMPMLMLAEAEGIALQELQALPEEVVENLVHQKGILIKMIDSALDYLQQAKACLPEEHREGWLAQMIDDRMKMERERRNRYRTISFLRTVSRSLSG